MSSRFLLLPALLALLLSGCNRGVQSEAAVRQGVIDYLSARSDLNMSQLDVDVSSVSFRENEADATVSVRPRGTPSSQGMQIRYTLERKANRWVVKGKGQSQAGQAPHGAMPMPGMGGPMPPGHPPMGQPGKGTAAAPQGGQPPSGTQSK